MFSDAFAEVTECDAMLLGSGSIRAKQLGPIVTLKDYMSCFPYDDTLTKFYVSGNKIKKIFSHIMRVENRDGEGECYQVNAGVKAIYNEKNKKLTSLLINGNSVEENTVYSLCIQGYHHTNCVKYLNITNEELQEEKCSKIVTTSVQEVLEEYLRNNQNLKPQINGRLVFV